MNKVIWILLIVLFFIAGAAGSYLFLKHFDSSAMQPAKAEAPLQSPDLQDVMTIRLFLPKDGKLDMSERKIQRRIKNNIIAEAVIEEFLKNGATASPIPENVKLLGLYRDSNHILYLDLSDELRRNFQGDALSEYLILKGIYETLAANLQDFQDLKILVEGKELETFGGHISLKYPLKNTVLMDSNTGMKPVQ